MTPTRSPVTCILALSISVVGGAACAAPAPGSDSELGSTSEALTGKSEPSPLDTFEGAVLFNLETFHGNGRTCATCHTSQNNGTLSPAEARAIYKANPHDPLFRPIDSDDGVGNTYTRLLSSATIRITLPLPPNVRPLDDLQATEVVLNRGIPTTLNTPALDPTLMSDGRAPNLESQALSAVNSHFQPRVEPTSGELSDIADFEQTLFSNPRLAAAAHGAPLSLPEGNTASQRRGREFFTTGICGACHGGALMNSNPNSPVGAIDGSTHFNTALAGFFPTDLQINPMRVWMLLMPDMSVPPPPVCAAVGGSIVSEPYAACAAPAPDPGRVLITGNPLDLAGFKIPILWNIKNTAPYFHDNSAATLQDVLSHYNTLFLAFPGLIQTLTPPGTVVPNGLSDQDEQDIIAFMDLL